MKVHILQVMRRYISHFSNLGSSVLHIVWYCFCFCWRNAYHLVFVFDMPCREQWWLHLAYWTARNDLVIYSLGSFTQKLRINWLNFSLIPQYSKVFIILWWINTTWSPALPSCTYDRAFYSRSSLRQLDTFLRKTQKLIKSKFAFLGLDGTAELVWLDNLLFLFYFLFSS